MRVVVGSLLAAQMLLVYCNSVTTDEIQNPSRPAMGHMARLTGEKYDLFKQYFRVFKMDEIAEREGRRDLYQDDWRNFSPTSDQCVKYLTSFIDNDYKLKVFLDLIFLDSCLGYLYDDHQYRWADQTNALGKKTLESLIANEKLKKIYTGTKLETLDARSVKFFKDLFRFGLALLFGNSMSCFGWIRVATRYAQGRHLLGTPDEDTYVDLMSDVAKRQGIFCFKNLADDMSERLEFRRYDTRILPNPKNFFPTPARKQLVQSDWPRKLLKVLQTIMGVSSSTAIDFDQLQLFAYKLKQSDTKAQARLKSNLKKCANKRLERPSSISQEEAQTNYKGLKEYLCKDYVDKMTEDWIKILSYRDFFGDIEWLLYHFSEKYPEDTKRVRVMYLTFFMCRYVDMTDATASPSGYEIGLPKNSAEIMKLWPMSPPSEKNPQDIA